eukprot:s1270_g28.t1
MFAVVEGNAGVLQLPRHGGVEVVAGIELAGAAPYVDCFDPSFKPAKMTVGELGVGARAARVALFASVRSSGDADLDTEVLAKTLAELECGWLEGPFDPADLPPNAVVSRRFGIKQVSGEVCKVRLIDDFTASGVNATVQVETSNKLHTLDVAASICMELLKRSSDNDWVGKTVDLSAAYRQLGIAPTSKWVSYIAVFDPVSRKPKVFSMRALPFGASRSVYGFLRVAHSLWWLGCVALNLLWSNFFDDFVTLARKQESETVGIATSQFFRLLGWEISSGDKDLPFAATFKALGVEINLEPWKLGKDGLLAHLKRTYVTPLRLDAAFDTDEDCLEMLISEFPDIVEEDALDAVAQLCIWKESFDRPLKRFRGEIVRSTMFRLPTCDQPLVHEEFTRLTQTSALCILEMHAKRKQRKYKEDR